MAVLERARHEIAVARDDRDMMRVRSRSLAPVIGFVAVGCHAREPAPPSAAAPIPTVVAGAGQVDRRPSEDAGAPPASDAGAPCHPLLYARASCYREPERDGTLDDDAVAAWFRSRGAKRPAKPLVQDTEGNCREARVGAPPEDALVCELGTQEAKNKLGDPTWWHRLVGRTRVHVVRGGRTVTVFDHPDVVDTLPVVPGEEPGPLFALSANLVSSTEIVVSEIADGSCDEALRRTARTKAEGARETNAMDRAATVSNATEDERLLGRMCKGVGRWTWKNGAFHRER
jgi:hypothetical protein